MLRVGVTAHPPWIDLTGDSVEGAEARLVMDRRPYVVDGSRPHRLPDEWLAAVRDNDWVADAWLRLRDEGHVFVGELPVVPVPGTRRLVEKLEDLGTWVRAYDWRMQDLVVAPVGTIDADRN